MSETSAEHSLRCDTDCLPFYTDCDYIFREVAVTPAREGGTLVQWALGSEIRDEGTYEYSLQVGTAGVDDPRAWKTIQTGTDVCFLIDPVRQLPSVQNFTHYRVKLKTSESIYFSRPLHTFGKLKFKDWRESEAVLRAEGIQLSRLDGTVGTLLKRKISGRKCPRCLDFGTGEVKDGKCPVCYATGWVGGYYAPVPCYYINIDPTGSTIAHDINMQGPVADTQVIGRALAVPILMSQDVWINGESSERFRIMKLRHLVEVKGVPIVYQAAMERIPFSDIVYNFRANSVRRTEVGQTFWRK